MPFSDGGPPRWPQRPRMNNDRRINSAGLVILLLFLGLLARCGGNPAAPSKSPAQSSSEIAAESKAAQGAVNGSPSSSAGTDSPPGLALGSESSVAPEPDSVIPLRSGVEAAASEVATARALVSRDWGYVMPRPKSAQARWGNGDGRTTWWNGYWVNRRTRTHSARQPNARDDYAGDGAAASGWRRGGAPRRPSVVEWLCSKSGGILPK